MPTETTIDETLRLARDLCLGVGTFYVTEAGSVFSNMSDVMRPDDADERMAALARSCLTHPSARGAGLFWSAESPDDASTLQPDWSLACVVAPVSRGDRWLGLLGVVDVWLPELDDEQRAGLLALASDLVEQAEPKGAEAVVAPPEPQGALWEPLAPHRRSDTSAEPFLGEILDHLPDGLLVARIDGTIVLVNQTFEAMTGLPLDTVLGEDVTQVLRIGSGPEATGAGPHAQGAREAHLESLLGEPEPGRPVLVGGGASDGTLTLDAAGRRIESRFAGDCFVTLVRGNEPADRVDQDGHRVGQVRIQALLDDIEDGIVCCDKQGIVVVANLAARRLQGLSDDELQVGAPFPSVVRLQTLEGHALSVEEHPLVRSMLDDDFVTEEFLLQDGEVERCVSISSRPLRVDGGDGAIAVLRDVTAERERQAHLTQYALYDPLTRVANRYLLNDALGRMLDSLERKGGVVSLIYLDLDRFKEINDEHGHDTGDGVLRAVAMRLERAVRGEDIVSRLGGDEFVVAHVTSDRLSDGDSVVARLRKVLSAPYRFGDLVLDVGASIGWVSTSSGNDSPEVLIAQADRAMYEHKHRRRAAERGVPT